MISLPDFLDAVDFAQSGSLLPDSELHGDRHWRAVASQGLAIADLCALGQRGRTTAALFGLFHDCRRQNDWHDPEHGLRGGQALTQAPGVAAIFARLPDSYTEMLVQSCTLHDKGHVTDDALMGLGWDADRSVLARCGIEPDFVYFSCVPKPAFEALIDEGRQVTRTPPSWEEIWARAFSQP